MIISTNSIKICVFLCASVCLYATPDEDLITAAHSGDLTKAKAALKAGANPNTRGFAETPPLISAAINGHAQIVALLVQAKADINARNLAKMSALDYAQMHKQTEVIRILIGAGAKSNGATGESAQNNQGASVNGNSPRRKRASYRTEKPHEPPASKPSPSASRPAYQPSRPTPTHDASKENRELNQYKACLNSNRLGSCSK